VKLIVDILGWITFAGSAAAVIFSVAALALGRGARTLLLTAGACLIFMPLIWKRFVNLDSGILKWTVWAAIAAIIAFIFAKPWRRLRKEHRRLFKVCLVSFVLVFPAIYILPTLAFTVTSPDRNVPVWLSFLLDIGHTLSAVVMVGLAAAAFLWMTESDRKSDIENSGKEPDGAS